MATVSKAIENLRLNRTPFWWLYNGNNKVGQYLENDDLNASINHLETVVALLPDGSYRLKASDKEANPSGAVHFTFSVSSKGQTNQPTAMQGTTTNAYGIPDHILKQVQEETRFKMLVENMADDFKQFMKEWPEYKKKIDKLLADDDDDGVPDFMEIAKKAVDVGNTAKEMKGFFK